MQKILKNKKGSISLFVLLSSLFFLVVVTSVGISFKNKEASIDSQFEKIKSSYEKDVGNEEQIYNEESRKYTVTFNANLFDAPAIIEDANGLNVSFDKSTSVLTINGTSSSTSTKTRLFIQENHSFVKNEEYTTKLEHISGSCTGPQTLGVVTDVRKAGGESMTKRNNNRVNIIPFGTNEIQILKINSLSETDGKALEYWLWYSEGKNNYTFDNYKVKVNFTKISSKIVKYNDLYGELPVPTKNNYRFDGWYTGENGTGTKIENTSVVQINEDTTLYAKWIENN